jgi:Type IV secretion-system coupling protein DNA-binding domain
LISGRLLRIQLYDFYPPPPYSHLLTQPEELKISSYECVFTSLAALPQSTVGVFQVLFQPVAPEHNWHRNIEILMDLEYVVKMVSNVGVMQRYAQQAPSGDLRSMSSNTETKAHNDKPFFAAACRIAIIGDSHTNPDYINSLALIGNLFQHGGRPLCSLTERDYTAALPSHQLTNMLLHGLTYRPGFLVNSSELVGLAHIPSATIAEQFEETFAVLDPITPKENELREGTPIGTIKTAGGERPVCIPDNLKLHHTHIIGSTGQGKSTLERHMILDDIKRGHGVTVLDPHGDLVEKLLYYIPRDLVSKVIYFDPGNPNWVPLWNPLTRVPGQDPGNTADNLLRVLKSFVTGWGDRMENILRESLYALLHIEGSTLLDVYDTLRPHSAELEQLFPLFEELIDNVVARTYWKTDFQKYRAADLAPPKHKLSKLLVSGSLSLMLCQPYSAFNFRKIMDDGMIFLVNLSRLGSEVREVIGGFILALMHVTALSRSDLPPEQRRPHYIYIDEAHKFVTDALQDMIAETRKYGVGLTLAHQYLKQFTPEKIEALAGTGTTIAFNIDSNDATRLSKGFKKIATVDDFINLNVGEAIVRSGTAIARIKTPRDPAIPKIHFKKEIIEHSRRIYCRPVQEVHQMIRRRNERFNKPFAPLGPMPEVPSNGTEIKSTKYKEF